MARELLSWHLYTKPKLRHRDECHPIVIIAQVRSEFYLVIGHAVTVSRKNGMRRKVPVGFSIGVHKSPLVCIAKVINFLISLVKSLVLTTQRNSQDKFLIS